MAAPSRSQADTRGPDRAVVIGASMAGLLAASVLAKVRSEVVVLDRDDLPTEPAPRGRAPQGLHAHGLLAAGRDAMEELLPGLTATLVEHGAIPGDLQEEVRWMIGGRELASFGDGRVAASGLLVSRTLLEVLIRQAVSALPNVEVIPRTTVTGLRVESPGDVSGVRLEGGRADLRAGLVIDASGRGSAAPEWLEGIGFAAPDRETVRVDLTYTTREFRRAGTTLGGSRAMVISPTPALPRGCALLAQEGDRWILTLIGFVGDRAPDDLAGFAEFASAFPSPWPRFIIDNCEPTGSARHFRVVESVRYRYDRVTRSPRGFLVLGDALCGFNPVYGQGMSVAALEAQALAEELHGDPATLAERFYRRAAKLIDGPWDVAVTSDLALEGVEGDPSLRVRVVNAYLGLVSRAASVDPEVARRLLLVLNLQRPPASLFAPRTLAAVLAGAARSRHVEPQLRLARPHTRA